MKLFEQGMKCIAISFLLLFVANMAFAQKGVVMTQKMMTLESDVLQRLIADRNLEKTGDIVKYLFDLPFEELYKPESTEARMHEMVMYLQDGKFRMDMQAPMGKMSTIVRKDLDKMYNVMWAQKKYMEMSLSQIRQMREGVIQNMPDMSKMLDRLPPEAREKALEAMKQAGQMQKMYTQPPHKESQSVEKSGRKKTINGFACEEWIVRKGNNISAHWVTSSKPELANMIKDFSETMSAGPGMNKNENDDGKEIWELVPGAIPIESREFRQRRMGSFELEITRVKKIEQKHLKEKTFEVPERFEPGSMFDMMNMKPGKKE